MKNNVSETIQVTSSDLFLLKKYKVINLWVINLVLHVTVKKLKVFLYCNEQYHILYNSK